MFVYFNEIKKTEIYKNIVNIQYIKKINNENNSNTQ